MNRQTTYFLQRVLTGLTTSVIYALFDNYRYNQSSQQYRRRPKQFSNKRKYYAQPKKQRDNQIEHYETNYNRNNRYQ